jgi:dTDP-4-amino-4,6-dideoxygalactose transaminase
MVYIFKKIMKVPYFVPWITNNDKKEVLNSLNQRWFTNGPILEAFENNFAKYIGCKFSLGITNATSALHLSLHALDIGEGDEVLVPVMTFAATADVVTYRGAKVIFCDVDVDTFNISIKEIKKKITKKTRAIIVVHYGGQACDMDEIIKICKEKNIHLIEDCAHSLGSTYKNEKCGTFGATGCFSFYPTKIITTGEGGMLVTNNKNIASRVKILRSHGMNIIPREREEKKKWSYDILEMGYNYRLDDIRASLGISQLKRVDIINKRRIKIAQKYIDKLHKVRGITLPFQKEDRNHIFHLFTIKIDHDFPLTRDELFLKLASKGIGSSVQYIPLHLMTYRKSKQKFTKNDFPIAERIKDQILSLPVFPTMTSKQVEFVVKSISN